jgi:CBS domain-containing protein
VLHPDATLKAALDGIVTSRTRVAVVVDGDGSDNGDGHYLGMLTVDDLAEGITT